MNLETIKNTMQYIIDEVLPDSDHNITSIDMSQVKNDSEFELHFTLKMSTEKEKKAGF